MDLLFLHARELALELVGFAGLAGVELGLPVEQPSAATPLALTRVGVKVVKEPQEGSEGNIGVVEVWGEESHGACLVENWFGGDIFKISKES